MKQLRLLTGLITLLMVNTTTNNASKISTLENVTNIQSKEISTLEDDISNNASRIVAINNSFNATTDKLKTDLKNESTKS